MLRNGSAPVKSFGRYTDSTNPKNRACPSRWMTLLTVWDPKVLRPQITEKHEELLLDRGTVLMTAVCSALTVARLNGGMVYTTTQIPDLWLAALRWGESSRWRRDWRRTLEKSLVPLDIAMSDVCSRSCPLNGSGDYHRHVNIDLCRCGMLGRVSAAVETTRILNPDIPSTDSAPIFLSKYLGRVSKSHLAEMRALLDGCKQRAMTARAYRDPDYAAGIAVESGERHDVLNREYIALMDRHTKGRRFIDGVVTTSLALRLLLCAPACKVPPADRSCMTSLVDLLCMKLRGRREKVVEFSVRLFGLCDRDEPSTVVRCLLYLSGLGLGIGGLSSEELQGRKRGQQLRDRELVISLDRNFRHRWPCLLLERMGYTPELSDTGEESLSEEIEETDDE